MKQVLTKLVLLLGVLILLNGCSTCTLGPIPIANPPPSKVLPTKAWGKTQILQTVQSSSKRDTSQLAITPSGDTMAIWVADNPQSVLKKRLYAIRYNSSKNSWGNATELENHSADNIAATVEIDTQGNAIVVWTESQGSGTTIYANRYDAAQNLWMGVQQIGGNPLFPRAPAISITPNGNAVIAWTEQCRADTCQANLYYVKAAQYRVAENRWTAATLLNRFVIGKFVDFPAVAVDANGNAIVTWQQLDNRGLYVINAACYDVSKDQWGSSSVINQTNYGEGRYPWVAMDLYGNAWAIWAQGFADFTGIGGAQLERANNAWAAAARVDKIVPRETFTFAPELRFAPNGDAILFAFEYTARSVVQGTADAQLYSHHYDQWYGATRLDQTHLPPEDDPANGTVLAGSVQAAMDAYGNALAIWSQQTDAKNLPGGVYTRHFDGQKNLWEDSQKIDTLADLPFNYTPFPHIGIDLNGNATAVWMEYDGTEAPMRLVFNRYQ